MRIVCFSAYQPGPKSAGLNLEILPLSLALKELGHELVTLVDDGRGRYSAVSLADSTSCDHISGRRPISLLPPALNEAASWLWYSYFGRLVPVVLRPSDFILALDDVADRVDKCDVVMSFKPWFRNAVPALRLANKLAATTILWLDDYDVTPQAGYLSRFDLVCVNSGYLSKTFARLSPLYLPHVIEEDLWTQSRIGTRSSGARPSCVVVLPGTGYDPSRASKVVNAVRGCLPDASISVIGGSPELARRVERFRPLRGSTTVMPWLTRQEVIDVLDGGTFAIVLQPLNYYGRAKASGRLLECLARGLPVIVENSGESASIVHESEAGFVTKVGDFMEVGRAALAIAQDSTLRARLESAAIAYTRKRGTWLGHAARLISKLEEARRS